MNTIETETHEPSTLATSDSACFDQAIITVWKKLILKYYFSITLSFVIRWL